MESPKIAGSLLLSIVCFVGCFSGERPAKQQLLINDGIVFNSKHPMKYVY